MLISLFLPYADQDRPPLNARAICTQIEVELGALSVDTEIRNHHDRLGIMIASSRVGNQAELWDVVESVLPDGVFTEPRS